jgi:ABC-type nitrate/sulfonate/bicarbonate transport system substrate-binding protein
MRIALPDLISNSYFPAAAAVELGIAREMGLDATVELLFPVNKTYEALRDGKIDFVAGSAHSALAAFPEWEGCKLICAQGQGMYWFLVMRADLDPKRGDLSIVKGRRIGAAPWVDMGLRQLLIAGGIDLAKDEVTIAPVPGAVGATVNFGLTAAQALEKGLIDGFWANGMGAEVALRSGAGKLVLDIRRGDGPPAAFNFTMASIATSDRTLKDRPEAAAAMVRAIVETHRRLKADVTLATQAGRKLFPPSEAELIADIVRRDLPCYDATISPAFVKDMNAFARAENILKGDPPYERVVATQFAPLWKG